MSIRAMNWAWGCKLAPTPKLILMALADAANESDECWPGVPFIAQKCCVSERTVQRVLREFQEAQLMTVQAQFDPKNGRRRSNRYRLNIGTPPYPDNLSPQTKKRSLAGDNLSGGVVTSAVTYEGDTAKSPLEPQHESKQQPLHFPTSLSNVECQAISAFTANISCDDAQALVDELADALETKTIKTNAMRWFRGLIKNYEQGEFIAAGGLRIASRRMQARVIKQEVYISAAQTTGRTMAKEKLAQIRELMAHRRSLTDN
jgi:hypothetical protein